ncbi:MAG: exodeoxyribonuclease III [bacterium]|nr:exodeoxyribonuclease III [bacterium]
MKIASFNVNSIRARLELLLQYLKTESPDILGLQETKVQDHEFPVEALADAGYEVDFFGQKSYNGVALLSKVKPLSVQRGFKTDGPEDQKRFQAARFRTTEGKELVVVNGYFPQGENREHPTKFPAKKKFYEDLQRFLANEDPSGYLMVMGDFNISPTDLDIGIGETNAKRWLKTGKCSFLPEEREWLGRMAGWGLFDSFRELHPEVKDQFSWFDYRSGGYPDRGLRIDQIWVTKPLLEHCLEAGIDYHLRAQERPSDHCVIWSRFNLGL